MLGRIRTGLRPAIYRNHHAWKSMSSAIPVRLTEEERKSHLADLPGWTMVPDREAITREFIFDDFREAFSYMTQVALQAEKHDHHP